MLRDIVLKTLRDQRRSLLAWSVAVGLLVAMYTVLWPSIRDQPSMTGMLDEMPEAFRSLFAASGADLSTPEGYVQVELLAFMGPIVVVAYAIGQGAGGIAGEEERATLSLLLTGPVGRSGVLWRKAVAMVVGTLVIVSATGVAIVVLGRPFGLDLGVGGVAAAMLHLAALGVVFGALALAVGAATGRSGLARGVAAGVAVVAYVVNGLAPMVGWLAPFQRLSPFFQYIGHDPLRNGVSVAALLVAVLTTLALLLAAASVLGRRDLRS